MPTEPDQDHSVLRQQIIIAGYRTAPDDHTRIHAALGHDDAAIREVALGAAERAGLLDDHTLAAAMTDPVPSVRRRAVELAAGHRGIDLIPALNDPDPSVVEVAAWAAGEHEDIDDRVLERLIDLATDADDQLVRESAAAALGAIGDERGLPAILQACRDRPAVRRRAVLALAPFIADGERSDGGEPDPVDAAIERALGDRDWQVRQAAEDLCRAMGRAIR